ncbi:hypothetical protein JTB14_033623 [Gonioctena quinquepunctata]|nr:hypothetical protein JTB14_033623 [Gonioctena quinquepunctata]
MNIQTSLKQCCDIAILVGLRRKRENFTIASADTEANFVMFKRLLEDDWKFEISTSAAHDLHIKKWNKITILPLAADLRDFRQYLLKEANACFDILNKEPTNVNAYTLLIETTFCRLMLLNRKRVGELQRLPLHLYESSATHHTSEEFSDCINPSEKILLKKFKRVVTRGKRGRGVPVLFSEDIQEHVDKIIALRKNFVHNNNIYLFPKLNTENPITGYQIMSKHAKASNLKNPNAITSTRKHLATMSQIFAMTSNDLEQLSTFMGHTSDVHKQAYRLPDDVYQTAKISKLLLLMEKGEASQFKGKTLDEINLNLEEAIIEDSDSEPEEDFEENLQQHEPALPSCSIPIKKKRCLVPWTQEQKDLTKQHFVSHIKSKVPPEKRCRGTQDIESRKFDNKSWEQIKVFVQNIYKKK